MEDNTAEGELTTRIGKDSIKLLTKDNYITWKESFENLSMGYSEAGQMWRTRIAVNIVAPVRTAEIYAANGSEELGDKMFLGDYDKYSKKVEKMNNNKQTHMQVKNGPVIKMQ